MSGFEVVGAVSAIIAILDSIMQVAHALRDLRDLPQAFVEVHQKLPLVKNILREIEDRLKQYTPNPGSSEEIEAVLTGCQERANHLEVLFKVVTLPESASRMKRYTVAMRTITKGRRVEILMKGVIQDVQLLMDYYSFRATFPEQIEQLKAAEEQLSALPPSVPDEGPGASSMFQTGSGLQFNHSGSGTQNNNTGSGQQFAGSFSAPFYFGPPPGQ